MLASAMRKQLQYVHVRRINRISDAEYVQMFTWSMWHAVKVATKLAQHLELELK